MLPQLNEKTVKLVRDNKTLALIILLLFCCMWLVRYQYDQNEIRHQEDLKRVEDLKEVIKIYRDANMRSSEVEKASRLFNEIHEQR